MTRSHATRRARSKALVNCRTRAGLLEFSFKASRLPFQPLYGGLWMEHGLSDVVTKGADDAEPVAGAGPCPGQNIAGGSLIAPDFTGQGLRIDALTQKQRQAI